jgi:hypothetical protein
MNPFKQQVTSPDVDAWVSLVCGIIGLMMCLILRSWYVMGVSAGLLFNFWRLRRKIAASNVSRNDPDSN